MVLKGGTEAEKIAETFATLKNKPSTESIAKKRLQLSMKNVTIK
jgi:hypothetical protein